ncbi:MAG TPA: hypothetical protein VGF24_00055 [Vicinamibacterales bacterium]|jgi:hypothetical protein
MRNAHLAEWILSLVTTPERAAATVGDLVEVHAAHGSVRFWISVVATLGAHVWSDLAAHPIRMTLLGLQGIVLQLLLSLALAFGLGLSYAVIRMVVKGVGELDARVVSGWGENPAPWLLSAAGVLGWLSTLLSSYFVGRILARRSPGRELAPCVASVVMGFVLPYLAFEFVGRLALPTATLVGPFWQTFLYSFPPFVALMTGAISVRRQRLASS